MKRLGMFFSCVLSLYLAYSCSEKKHIILDPEKITSYHCDKEEILPINTLAPLMIIPSSNYIITMHNHENHFFKVFSTKDYTLIDTVLNKGRGPGELPSIGFISQWQKIDGEFNILTYQYGNSLARINVDKSIKQKMSEINYLDLKLFDSSHARILNQTSSIKILPDNQFLLLVAPFQTELEPEPVKPYYAIYDNEKDTIVNTYKISSIKGKNNKQFRTIYDIISVLSKDNQRVGLTINGLKTINIIDLFKDSLIEIKFPDSPKRMKHINPNTNHFRFTQATNRFLWVLTVPTIDANSNAKSKIYLIDWNGTPLHSLLIEKDLRYFYPVEEEQCLYAIDNEDIIYRYDLKDFYI